MVGSKKINLIIYTNEPIPIGMAATNRLMSYSKGLAELGHNVIVCSSKPGFNEFYNENIGNFEGVEYKVLTNSKYWDENVLKKLISFIKSHFLFFNFIVNKHYTYNNTIILIITNKIFSIFFIKIISKIKGIKLIQEKSEYPFICINSNYFKKKILCFLYSNIIYKLFDGMIVMTEPLFFYFKKKVKKHTPIFIYPLTIDTKRFIEAKCNEKFNFRYIGYVGYMGGNKDGVSDLLNAFKLFTDKYKINDVKLVLVGTASEFEINILKQKTAELDINERVIFFGKMDRILIPSFLKTAELLVLTRPDNLQARGGFPTKLGEYFASGRPTVLTKVGEIPKLLKHEYHAILCEPGNLEQIANAFYSILTNSDNYLEMRNNAREFAVSYFDYKIRISDLENFLYNILK